MKAFRSRGALAAVLCGSVLLGTGCRSGGSEEFESPYAAALDDEMREDLRIEAIEEIWAFDGETPSTRNALREVAWSQKAPIAVRERALTLLLSPEEGEGLEEAKRLAELMLPREKSRRLVSILAQTIAERGWDELTTALVRSFAQTVDGVPDDERAEAIALRRLHPDSDPVTEAFVVFVSPWMHPDDRSERGIRRARYDAWALMDRLDPGAEARARLLAQVDLSPVEDDRAVAELTALKRAQEQFGVTPGSVGEIEWLLSLADARGQENRARNGAWWSETAGVIAGLPASSRDGLRLRHLESIRWAATNEPGWASASRAELLSTLRSELEGRGIRRRTVDIGRFPQANEFRLQDWESTLSWGDLISLLVLDRACREPEVIERWAVYLRADREDEATAYGGTLRASEKVPGGWAAILFKPRSSDRLDDAGFIASYDLLRNSDRDAAHFRLNTNKRRNFEAAGPGEQDFAQARETGRLVVMVSTLDGSTWNIDVYDPSGWSVDMGMVSP